MLPWKRAVVALALVSAAIAANIGVVALRTHLAEVRAAEARFEASQARAAAASASVAALVAAMDAAAERQNVAERAAYAAKVASNGDAVGAWVYAQVFVKRTLKSPGSADFGGVFSEYQNPNNRCAQLGDKSWRCTGWVDAQNAFGAKLRADWAMTLRMRPGGGWAAVDGPTLTER